LKFIKISAVTRKHTMVGKSILRGEGG